jgi:hypothetical protein
VTGPCALAGTADSPVISGTFDRSPKICRGTGSRKTPGAVLDRMARIAAGLAQLGWTLRSGGADGVHSALFAQRKPARRGQRHPSALTLSQRRPLSGIHGSAGSRLCTRATCTSSLARGSTSLRPSCTVGRPTRPSARPA